jgi:2-polyprenyl-3-methyl-5-hydroxy-6-metoxy-1,4-benzoquinol methylase
MISHDTDPNAAYYHIAHDDLLGFFEPRDKVVVDIGCASGALLKLVKQRGARRTIGVEARPEVAAELAASGEVDEVLCLDIERDALPLDAGSADVVIVSHVLEHMADPWSVLRTIRGLLKPGGVLVGALPNIRHIRVVFDLLVRGQWKYVESGVMDKTHLRFFTRHSLNSLLCEEGFVVGEMRPEIGVGKATLVSRATFGLFDDLLAYAYSFRCTPRP